MGPARPLRVAMARALESFQSHESEAWHPGAAFLGRPGSPPWAPKPPPGDPTSLREGTGPRTDAGALFLKRMSEIREGLGRPGGQCSQRTSPASSGRCLGMAVPGGRRSPALLT